MTAPLIHSHRNILRPKIKVSGQLQNLAHRAGLDSPLAAFFNFEFYILIFNYGKVQDAHLIETECPYVLDIKPQIPKMPFILMCKFNYRFDESFAERVWGLTEMFPERLRTGSANAVSSSVRLVKGAYDLSRQVVWIAVSTSILLFAPVMFEIERLNVEEMMKQDRNRLVLGPGSAMSGGPPAAPGLMPPPPAR
nr:mitochondrial import receptor subunit TOM22 homolog [Penaeus vannamei]